MVNFLKIFIAVLIISQQFLSKIFAFKEGSSIFVLSDRRERPFQFIQNVVPLKKSLFVKIASSFLTLKIVLLATSTRFHRINDYVTPNRPQVDQVITDGTRFLLVRIFDWFRFETFGTFLIITVTVTY